MNVLILSPGYPADMPEFTRGLAECGARVYGVGDQPTEALPDLVKHALSGYIQVRSLWDGAAVIGELQQRLKGQTLDRIECLWEPGIMLAAELRRHFGIAGLTVEQAHRFRDKEAMKQALDAAGIRTPRHAAVDSIAGCWEAAEEIGFPLILKPIAGAGSADTYRVQSADELRAVLPRLRHVPSVSVEEFVDGEEYTFDTITIDGEIAYHNIAWYRPRPLVARSNEWISPQVIALRDADDPQFADAIEMGHDVIAALEFGSGFTHMEWYRKSDGEVVFGEIGARPPGAHQVDQMKYACDFDVFRAWGSAMTQGRLDVEIERRYNVATIYKRARGLGRITHIEGADELQRRFGAHVVWNTLLPPGSPRRDWLKTLVSDGFIMLRHPDLDETLAMADAVGSELHLYAA
ncbi:MAG: ATP-grasp domain-containing protein [Gammaproteobacteria bacterium]|nr:ATP-grasp domain-containing protein [Gammaproteobacteria bacterium]MDH3435339.1 ATP-grasp domain-containing protein [Gammaproteobacteria bacterium]